MSTSSGPWAQIDLDALRANLARCRACAPNSRVWAVIKADAYGHGIGHCAAALSEADGFAVARVPEALGLRWTGIRKPILVMEGAADADELQLALSAGLELVVHSVWQVELLERCPDLNGSLRSARVWLKVDTGMGRLGVAPSEVDAVISQLRRRAPLFKLAGLITHLANADDPSVASTLQQCEQARTIAQQHALPVSIGNSAGILAHPLARSDWVRPGIMLYGGSPLLGRSSEALQLRQVMTLSSHLIAVKSCEPGATIGYGSTYRCPEAMRVGVVAVGYGDGYPRHAPTGTPVLIGDQRVPLIGRVSMDMITVDLRAAPAARPGDTVRLWGPGLPVEDVAAKAGTINYELLCRLSPRVRLVHRGASTQQPD